jgi:hypothetical protein
VLDEVLADQQSAPALASNRLAATLSIELKILINHTTIRIKTYQHINNNYISNL